MKLNYSAKNNPRVIIIQILYSRLYNQEIKIVFPKHRFKKFIKDVVLGTLERNEIIEEEIKNHLVNDINLNKSDNVLEVIVKSAIYEFLYKPNTSRKIVIKEYLYSSKKKWSFDFNN